jgi:flagellar basal-body rod protein FlgF
MNRGIFAAANGMRSNQLMLDVLSNNLANVNTTGFKADGVAFTDMLERQMAIPDGAFGRNVGTLGSGATIGANYTTNAVGDIAETGRPLDVSLAKADQYFVVETPNGQLYTRDGSFSISGDGTLVTADGFPVLSANGNTISMPPGAKHYGIEADGNVTADGRSVGVLDVREGQLKKIGRNLFEGEAESVPPQLVTEALEGSNVNAIETMVQMISVMRGFEAAQKMIQSQDEATGQLIQSLAR